MRIHDGLKTALALTALCCGGAALAQEAAIRQALAERMPQMPKVDEVRRTPIDGLWEVRYGGTEILYSDAKGEHVLTGGSMLETRTGTNLTDARIEKLLAIAFDKLPLKDAVVMKQGSGARRMAVFADPNCGYCKRLEQDLAQIKDVTIYTFVIPILGAESSARSRDIWCARDSGLAWRRWMLDGRAPARASAKCSVEALDRNLAFARDFKVNGTPAMVFEDGTRKPGALARPAVEELLAAATRK